MAQHQVTGRLPRETDEPCRFATARAGHTALTARRLARRLQLAAGMSETRTLVQEHFRALLEDAKSAQIPMDVVGRTLLGELIGAWTQERTWSDVADELRFTADSLDPDRDFEFMRP